MQNPKYSIIVPVYNRPDEVQELLESLTNQKLNDFEVIIVEDGSTVPCKEIVDQYSNQLNLKYFTKENTGPGTTRNYGANKASGEYFIFFDSDCIIPEYYLTHVEQELNIHRVDAFGGPDRAHPSFTPIQKAINYSMTSFFTTGGIRGGKERLDKFYPRSFNMGVSRQTFEKTGGFSTLRFGEDIDFSLRIINNGFTTRLFPEAFVYHKRRTDFKKFYRQVYNSGIARINLNILHPKTLKIVHTLPSVFVIAMLLSILASPFTLYTLTIPVGYSLLVVLNSLVINKNMRVAILSVAAAWVQLFGYGIGFIEAFWKRIILKKGNFKAFEKNFYK
ncbi:MAG: glycosyltransferase [Bacteroidales bacterium]|nr:glycosyltransferase [Bacteroidales bacterium]MDD4671465.1 glycosyltransferase [Bacteroidales bacterium]MDY0347909.1 glycosyltransferase [Tenuifilaceae bacterium]